MDEFEILSSWALRFDGYLHQRETGFILEKHLRHFLKSGGVLGGIPLDHRAAFFLAQRYFIKWGECGFPPDGFEIRYLRTLFLAVVDYPVDLVPYHLCFRQVINDETFERLLPHKAIFAAAIRHEHGRTDYQSFDDAMRVWDSHTLEGVRAGDTFGEASVYFERKARGGVDA